MIIGIGIDIVEIERVSRLFSETAFLTRCFTKKEQQLFETSKHPSQKASGNFAAKEALAKALGTGLSGFSLTDIEVLREENGRPYIIVHNRLKDQFKEKQISAVHVSISNTDTLAIAQVICESGC